MKSKVVEITYKRAYENSHIYEVLLENKDRGQYWSKIKEVNNLLFKVGEEIEYELKPNTNPNYLPTLVVKLPTYKLSAVSKEKQENRRVALQCATSLIVSGHKEMKLFELAEVLYAWLQKT